MRLRTASTQEAWAVWRALLFLLKKEPMVFSDLVRFGPASQPKKVKACALIGLHMMAEEYSWWSDSGSFVSSSSSG